METKEIQNQIEKVAKEIDERIEKSNEQLKLSVEEKIDGLTKGEIKNLVEKHEELTGRLDKAEAARMFAGKEEKKTILDVLQKSNEFKSFKEKSSKSAAFEIDMKTMTQAGNLTGDVIEDTRVPGIVYDPTRPTHVRSYLSVGTTSSNNVIFNQESDFTSGFDITAEAADKKVVEFDLEAIDNPVRKITGIVRMSEELLEDVEGMQSYLSARLPAKLRVKEDQQLLYGTGIGSPAQIKGLTVAGNAFSPTGFNGKLNDMFAVLIASVANVRKAEYAATAIMINPDDFHAILLDQYNSNKFSTGMYAVNAALPTIAGVPLIQNTAIASGDFLTGDFRQGAQIFDRKGLSLQFSYEDRDNFQKNLVTVRLEERLTLVTYRPSAFSYGNFANIISAYSGA